jgi:rod shape-determining protein MreC
MQYSPPPLFKQGAPARVKVTVFALLSIALLVADSRFQALTTIRQITGTILYPLQMAALMPRDALQGAGGYFSSQSKLQAEVSQLRATQIANAQAMQVAKLQAAENLQLRKLMGARAAVPLPTLMGEILYDARDSATRKIVLDRGSNDNVQLGLPVIDNAGVVGQVTRVFPLTSEVTLLTDKEQAIPVQVLRNGLRSVAHGGGQSGVLELRFVTPNADIVVGDVLITSGLDGVYPAGLAVAQVSKVEQRAGGTFGNVLAQPLAGINRHRHLLFLMAMPHMAPRPPAESTAPLKKSQLSKMTPIGAATATAPATAPAPVLAPVPVSGAANRPATPTPAPAATTPGSTLAPVNRPPVTTANAPTITRATVPPAAPAQPVTLPPEGTR